MATNSNGSNGVSSASSILQGLGAAAANSSTTPAKKGDQIGKDQFLQMLVAQLKNQDPLDPMKGDEFAVNLAQFSSLEQLVGINDKLSKQSDPTTTLSSMASYLGQEATLNTSAVDVKAGDGGLIRVNMPQAVSTLKIDLLKADGSVAGTASVNDLPAGRQTIRLNDLNAADGTYQVKVSGIGTSGTTVTGQAWAAGVVTGIVPGADPKLLVGGKEYSPTDVTEINLPHAV